MAELNLPIFLFSDFGLQDPYVGQVRAVIASSSVGSSIYDLTYDVPFFSIEEGFWLLGTTIDFLPESSIVLAIVDPGVGSSRLPIALKSNEKIFIGPDNGLLSGCIT